MGLTALANGDVWETIRAVQRHMQDGRPGVQQGGVGVQQQRGVGEQPQGGVEERKESSPEQRPDLGDGWSVGPPGAGVPLAMAVRFATREEIDSALIDEQPPLAPPDMPLRPVNEFVVQDRERSDVEHQAEQELMQRRAAEDAVRAATQQQRADSIAFVQSELDNIASATADATLARDSVWSSRASSAASSPRIRAVSAGTAPSADPSSFPALAPPVAPSAPAPSQPVLAASAPAPSQPVLAASAAAPSAPVANQAPLQPPSWSAVASSSPKIRSASAAPVCPRPLVWGVTATDRARAERRIKRLMRAGDRQSLQINLHNLLRQSPKAHSDAHAEAACACWAGGGGMADEGTFSSAHGTWWSLGRRIEPASAWAIRSATSSSSTRIVVEWDKSRGVVAACPKVCPELSAPRALKSALTFVTTFPSPTQTAEPAPLSSAAKPGDSEVSKKCGVEDLTDSMDSAFPAEDGGGKQPAAKEKASSSEKGAEETPHYTPTGRLRKSEINTTHLGLGRHFEKDWEEEAIGAKALD
eukprot:g8920.t1